MFKSYDCASADNENGKQVPRKMPPAQLNRIINWWS